jgi:hypothetical protein
MVPMSMGYYDMFDVRRGDTTGECVLLNTGFRRCGFEVFVEGLDLWWVYREILPVVRGLLKGSA